MTVCADVYVPVPGDRVGVATVSVYVAVVVFEVGMPLSHALALSVVVCVIAIVPPDATVGSLSVGFTPFVV